MLLRTRITLMACVCFVTLTVLLIAESHFSKSAHIERMETAVLAGARNTWLGIVESNERRLDRFVPQISRNATVVSALAAANLKGVASALAISAAEIKIESVSTYLEAVTMDGTFAFTSVPGGNLVEVLGSEVVTAIFAAGVPQRGLVRTRSGKYAVLVGIPVYSRFGPAGVIAIYSHLDELVSSLAMSIAAEIFLVDENHYLVHGSAGPLWDDIHPVMPSTPSDGIFRVKTGNHVMAATYFNISDIFDTPMVTLLMVRDISEVYWREMTVKVFSLGALASGLILFLAFLLWYMRVSFRPLNTVIRVLNRLSQGDTSVPVSASVSHDEIGRLASTVENFRQAQKDHNQLQKIRQDLDAAKHIQLSMLPHVFLRREHFSLHASMRAARDVGGDFYDFFELSDGRFGFVIADVSGKGMASALFMAVASTVIRTTAMMVPDPGACLEKANDFLCVDNPSCMFVTTFYGVLDPTSGRVVFANGGHNPPYCLSATGKAEPLELTGGMALGLMDGLSFAEKEVTLEPGERLFLYTDGITEAFNPKDEEYGDDRLKEVLEATTSETADKLIDEVIESVDMFAADQPQADDITCLSIFYDYLHPIQDTQPDMASRFEIRVNNKPQQSEWLQEQLAVFCERSGLTEDTTYKLNLCLEELLVNTMSYGFDSESEHEALVYLEMQHDLLHVDIIDDGLPFDPFTDAPQPDLQSPVEQRPIGGLGVHLVRSLTDSMEYSFYNNQNHVHLTISQ